MSKRALRRHHSLRMKAKARRVAKWSWGYRLGMMVYFSPETGQIVADEVELEKRLKAAEEQSDHLAVCSRHCCGNPRKWFKDRTLKEIAFERIAEEQEVEHEDPQLGD